MNIPVKHVGITLNEKAMSKDIYSSNILPVQQKKVHWYVKNVKNSIEIYSTVP